MKQILPYHPYQIVFESRYRTEQPQMYILQESTEPTSAEGVLIDFYKKGISIIEDVRRKVHAKYPQFYET
jgi:hypothetical protein